MITWLQKNKKYLIVTLWISGASFIGAGFVGWGQYSSINAGDLSVGGEKYSSQQLEVFSKSSGISVKEIRRSLVEIELVRAFLAKSGKIATDNDIRDHILAEPAFQRNGVFSEALYLDSVKSSVFGNAKKYESGVRRMLELKMAETFLTELTKPFKNEEILGLEKNMKMYSYKKIYMPELNKDETLKKWKNNKGVDFHEKIKMSTFLSVDTNKMKPISEDEYKKMSVKMGSQNTREEIERAIKERDARALLLSEKIKTKTGKKLSDGVVKREGPSDGEKGRDFYCDRGVCMLTIKSSSVSRLRDFSSVWEEVEALEYSARAKETYKALTKDKVVYEAMLPEEMMLSVSNDQDRKKIQDLDKGSVLIRGVDIREYYIIERGSKLYRLSADSEDYLENVKFKNEEKKKSIVSLLIKKILEKEGLESEVE